MALASSSEAQNADWYVDAATGSDTNTGDSWNVPFATGYKALASTSTGINKNVIYVAVGNYPVPPVATPNLPQTGTHWIPASVELYGGFIKGNDILDNRVPADFERTILSGDIDGNSAPAMGSIITDDAYHVVTASTAGWTIDGFKIEYGNAAGNGPLTQKQGGGIFIQAAGGASNTILKNVTVENCS